MREQIADLVDFLERYHVATTIGIAVVGFAILAFVVTCSGD